MKKIRYLFFSIVSVTVFFSICYYVSFRVTVSRLEAKKLQQNFDNIETFPELMAEFPDSVSNIVYEEVSSDYEIISSDTICVYEVVDLNSGETYCYETVPNADMAGLTREQLVAKLKAYMDNLPLSDFQDGLLSYDVISFSPERVVIRKVYDHSKVKHKYYIAIRNGTVIVFYSDRKTVYEYTGIPTENIVCDNINLLEEGIEIDGIEEVYDFLSGITS